MKRKITKVKLIKTEIFCDFLVHQNHYTSKIIYDMLYHETGYKRKKYYL